MGHVGWNGRAHRHCLPGFARREHPRAGFGRRRRAATATAAPWSGTRWRARAGGTHGLSAVGMAVSLHRLPGHAPHDRVDCVRPAHGRLRRERKWRRTVARFGEGSGRSRRRSGCWRGERQCRRQSGRPHLGRHIVRLRSGDVRPVVHDRLRLHVGARRRLLHEPLLLRSRCADQHHRLLRIPGRCVNDPARLRRHPPGELLLSDSRFGHLLPSRYLPDIDRLLVAVGYAPGVRRGGRAVRAARGRLRRRERTARGPRWVLRVPGRSVLSLKLVLAR